MASVFTSMQGEELVKTLKPEKLAFLSYFLISGLFLLVGLGLTFLFWMAGIIFIIIGVIGIIVTFFYLNAFTYHITNKRIIVYKKFITISSRQVQYDDLSDVVVDQGIFGRIFGFGNVIPVTKSGFGLGYRGTQMGIGYGYGIGRRLGGIVVGGPVSGRTVAVATPSTSIYGVKNPFEIKDLIFKYQEQYAETPYLKRIADAVAPTESKPTATLGKPAGPVKFCPFCGMQVAVPGAKFCPGCGKELPKSAGAPQG